MDYEKIKEGVRLMLEGSEKTLQGKVFWKPRTALPACAARSMAD